MNLTEILPHLESTYKSIDLNIASVLYENKWVNFITLVRFSHEDPNSLNKQVLENPHLPQLEKGNRFRIYKKAFPFENLHDLTQSFISDSIEINGATICYDSGINIEDSDTNFTRHSFNMFDKDWGEFYVFRSDKTGKPYKQSNFCDSLKGEVIPYGATDIFGTIRRYFELSDYARNYTGDFVIAAPVYVRIEKIELDGYKVKINARYHKELKNLILHYGRRRSLTTQDFVYGPVPYDQTKGVITEDGNFMIWQIEAEELDVVGQSYGDLVCDTSLFLPPLSSEISTMHRYIGEMIAEKKLLHANPLAKIFSKFCTIEKLKQMLINPIDVKRPSFQLSDTDNFERVVQWLFSLCGFSAIWLGKDFETMYDEHKRTDASTDLLCYAASERALAVVSCKTSVPDVKAIDLVKNLAEKFREELQEFRIRVVPIIVSSKPIDAVKQIGTSNDVDIIDVNDVKRIIEELYTMPPTPGLLLRRIRTSSTIGI